MLLGLRTAIYPVADLAAAKKWYTEMLGQPGTSGPQPLWGVAHIEQAFTHLLQLGAMELEPIAEVGEGIKVAAIKDPFGNRLGLIENPNFKKSEIL